MRLLPALLLALVIAVPLHAEAPPITLRSGDHPGFGRLVFDLPPGATAQLAAGDGQVTVQATGTAFTAAPPRLPRNLLHVAITGAQATLTLAPGATWRSLRLPGKLVIDLLDPAAPTTAPPPRRMLFSGPPPRPYRPLPPPQAPAPPVAAAAPPSPSAPRPPPPAVSPVDALPVDVLAPIAEGTQAAAPMPAGPLAIAVGLEGRRLTIPLAATTGAAAFRRGSAAMVVFDEPRPLDLSALRGHPPFDGAQVQVLPEATVLRLPLPPADALRLARDAHGWSVTLLPAAGVPPLAPIRAEPDAGRLRLVATAAARVLSVPDPATGADMLVGTQRAAGESVPVARRLAEFGLLATWQGVAVEPLSDNVVLRVEKPGFVVEAGGGRALALAPADPAALAATDAARLTRRWDFPPLAVPALRRRLQAATDDAAAAPAQARSVRRLAVAQAMLALGMDAEAQALARLVQTDDAREAEAPDAAGLGAVAALVAGRPHESAAIDDPRLSGTDEVALWRAVRRAQGQDGAPDAATVFAATLPLLLAYPQPLRDRLLPLAAETMVLGGERDAARRLLAARKDDAALDYARALLDQAEGRTAPALATLDRLAQSPDRWLRARASVRAVELRLHDGRLTPAQAADALERLIYAWRGDGRELALRLRVANLRALAGAYRPALAMLRETAEGPVAQNWPDHVQDLRARMRAVFAEALAADARTPLPPFDLVALVDDNPNLLPDGAAGQALAARLADRLAALDLPARAASLLQKLVDGTPAGAARSELGARLAARKLEQGDPAGALTALSASTATNLPAALEERRTLIFARATAARGGIGPAVAALAQLDTPPAADARAAILEAAKDWPAAEVALSDYARRTVPDSGPLDEAAARTLLRLASAAAQAGDEAVLAHLRTDALPRLPAGKLADMLRMLTEQPVRNVPDLPRAAQEAALAKMLPTDLHALGWTAAPAR